MPKNKEPYYSSKAPKTTDNQNKFIDPEVEVKEIYPGKEGADVVPHARRNNETFITKESSGFSEKNPMIQNKNSPLREIQRQNAKNLATKQAADKSHRNLSAEESAGQRNSEDLPTIDNFSTFSGNLKPEINPLYKKKNLTVNPDAVVTKEERISPTSVTSKVLEGTEQIKGGPVAQNYINSLNKKVQQR